MISATCGGATRATVETVEEDRLPLTRFSASEFTIVTDTGEPENFHVEESYARGDGFFA